MADANAVQFGSPHSGTAGTWAETAMLEVPRALVESARGMRIAFLTTIAVHAESPQEAALPGTSL